MDSRGEGLGWEQGSNQSASAAHQSTTAMTSFGTTMTSVQKYLYHHTKPCPGAKPSGLPVRREIVNTLACTHRGTVGLITSRPLAMASGCKASSNQHSQWALCQPAHSSRGDARLSSNQGNNQSITNPKTTKTPLKRRQLRTLRKSSGTALRFRSHRARRASSSTAARRTAALEAGTGQNSYASTSPSTDQHPASMSIRHSSSHGARGAVKSCETREQRHGEISINNKPP